MKYEVVIDRSLQATGVLTIESDKDAASVFDEIQEKINNGEISVGDIAWGSPEHEEGSMQIRNV